MDSGLVGEELDAKVLRKCFLIGRSRLPQATGYDLVIDLAVTEKKPEMLEKILVLDPNCSFEAHERLNHMLWLEDNDRWIRATEACILYGLSHDKPMFEYQHWLMRRKRPATSEAMAREIFYYEQNKQMTSKHFQAYMNNNTETGIIEIHLKKPLEIPEEEEYTPPLPEEFEVDGYKVPVQYFLVEDMAGGKTKKTSSSSSHVHL